MSDSTQIVIYLSQALEGLKAPLYYLSDPGSRLYWGFLLTSVVLAGCVFFINDKKLSAKKMYRAFFSRAYWLNRSTATDVSWLLTNSVLRAVVIVPLIGSHLWATIIFARFFQSNFGNAPSLELPLWAIMASFTLVFFLLEDATRFFVHMAMHKIPFLWGFHRTHHSAKILTPLTVFRVHSVEMIINFSRGVLVFGWVSGMFVYVFGSRLSGFHILGVDALAFIFTALGANLRHSHIWLRFGKFERWFISPAQHQIHHSRATQHHDKNFGVFLACWDRWCGSLVLSDKKRHFRFGLATEVRKRPRFLGKSEPINNADKPIVTL